MSVLANASNANPSTYYWSPAGTGGGTNIQSPVAVLPDALADASLSVNAGAALGNASLSVVAGAGGIGDIAIGGGGRVYDIKVPGAGGNQGHLQIVAQGLQANQTQVFDYNPATGNTIIGDSLPTGSVQIDQNLLVAGAPSNGNAVQIQSTSLSTSNIFNTKANNAGLILGSSAACPAVLAVVDTAGVGTQFVSVGAGGSGGNLRLQGASTAGYTTPIISNNNNGPATLNVGASANAPQLIFCTDPTGVADQAYVDITKGTANGVALRLQGYGAGSAATVSTNAGSGGGGVLNVTSGYNDSAPAIVISNTTTTMNRAMTTFVAPTAGSGTTYTGITRQSIAGGGSIGTTAYPLTNPPGAGVYTIMVQVGDGVAININGQIDAVGYFDGTNWIAGGVNVSPPIGTGNLILWFGSSSSSRANIILQNTGSANLSSVVVYMIPQLYGLQAVIV